MFSWCVPFMQGYHEIRSRDLGKGLGFRVPSRIKNLHSIISDIAGILQYTKVRIVDI